MEFNVQNTLEEVNNWKNNVLSIERNKDQEVKVNTHVDRIDKENYTYHSNNGKHSNYVPHSNGSYHSNYQGYSQSNPHSNTNSYHSNNHTNYTQAHANYVGPHTNGYAQANHQNYPGDHKNSGSGSNHNNYNGHYNTGHRDGHQNSGHANANGYHSQSGYNQAVPHSNRDSSHSNYHSNTKPHSDSDAYHSNAHYNNSNEHQNTSTHNNAGFDHVNYIPSIPHVYDNQSSDVLTLNGVQDIYFYSYDKNKDGVGSQFTYSTKVSYQLEIRQIKDLSENSKVTAWKTLQAYSTTDSYRIDTVDPLKVGNTDYLKAEGYYEIRVTAKNDTYEKVDFISQPVTKQIKIQQNAMPTITVNNPEEFLSFTFGFDGVLNKQNTFIEYQDMVFNKSKEEGFKGLFINISVLDNDIEDYLKGEVKIKSGSNLIATAPILWDTGEEAILSENKIREGYIYVSKDNLLKGYDNTSFKNAVIEIHLRDYKDLDATSPKGDFVISQKVNMTTGEDLFINIDKVAPKMSAVTGLNSVGQISTIKLTATDDISGVKSITLPNGNVVSNSTVSYDVSANGLYSFILTDKLNNSRMYTAEVVGVDSKNPSVVIKNNQNWTNNDVTVSITASD